MYPQLRSNGRGGIIIIYLRNHFKFTIIQHPTITFESITGRVKINTRQDIVVCAVYRPPNTNKCLFRRELDSYISMLNEQQNLNR